jgi:hypothetical protein
MRTFGTNDIHDKAAAQYIPDGGVPRPNGHVLPSTPDSPDVPSRSRPPERRPDQFNKSVPPRTNPAEEPVTSSLLVLWTLDLILWPQPSH